MITDSDIMNRGIACLIRELGIVEAEAFISYIKNDRFDYTKWRQDQFDDMTLNEIGRAAAEHSKKHPFKGNAVII